MYIIFYKIYSNILKTGEGKQEWKWAHFDSHMADNTSAMAGKPLTLSQTKDLFLCKDAAQNILTTTKNNPTVGKSGPTVSDMVR